MAVQKGSVRRDGLTIEYDREHCYTEYESCAIQIWRGEILKAHMAVMRARWEALIDRKGSFAMIVVVLASAPPPSTDRRHEIKEIYIDLADHLKAIASVFLGQGLKGSTASLVMSTMLLLAKSTYPTKNTTTIDSACKWLDQTVPGLASDKLKLAVDSALKTYGEICEREFKEGLVPTRQEMRQRETTS